MYIEGKIKDKYGFIQDKVLILSHSKISSSWSIVYYKNTWKIEIQTHQPDVLLTHRQTELGILIVTELIKSTYYVHHYRENLSSIFQSCYKSSEKGS